MESIEKNVRKRVVNLDIMSRHILILNYFVCAIINCKPYEFDIQKKIT